MKQITVLETYLFFFIYPEGVVTSCDKNLKIFQNNENKLLLS